MYRWIVIFLIFVILPAIAFGQIEQSGGVGGGADADSLLGIPMQDTAGNLYDNFIPKYNLAQNRFDWEADVGAAGGTTDTIGFVFDAITKYQVDKALKINLGVAFADSGVADSSGIDTATVYLDTTWLNTNYQIATAYLADRATADASGNTITSTYQPLEATLTDIADGTIAENLVNTANPWADNEIATSANWNTAYDSSQVLDAIRDDIRDTVLVMDDNWNTAYGWGDHGAQNYLDDDVSGDVDSDDIANQTIVRADIDSTVGVTLGDDSFIGNSNVADSQIMSKKYIDDAAAGLTEQSVKGDHVDSTAEDFVFSGAYRTTSETAGNEFATLNELPDSVVANESDPTVDTEAECETEWGAVNILLETEIDASSELLNIMDDETGTGLLVFSVAPTFTQKVSMDSLTADTISANILNAFDSLIVAGDIVLGLDDGDLQIDGVLNVSDDSHAHVITNIDAFTKANLETQTSDVADYAEADGDTWTGVHDFGGATSVEIPAVDAPTTNAEGEIAWDTNDDAIEVYSGDEGESVLIPIYRHLIIPIVLPDSVQTYVPDLCVFHANALMYPHGIEIDLVSIQLEADAAYEMVWEVWSAADPPAYENAISTLATGASDTYAEEAPDTDPVVEVGKRIFLDIPTTDVDLVVVSIYFHVTEGN